MNIFYFSLEFSVGIFKSLVECYLTYTSQLEGLESWIKELEKRELEDFCQFSRTHLLWKSVDWKTSQASQTDWCSQDISQGS